MVYCFVGSVLYDALPMGGSIFRFCDNAFLLEVGSTSLFCLLQVVIEVVVAVVSNVERRYSIRIIASSYLSL